MYKKLKLIIPAIILITAAVLVYHNFSARSASWSFVQTDWSGGASTTAEADHPGDASGWDRYYSADSVIATDTPGQISLSSTTASWTETATADFSAGTLSSTSATSGKVVLLKPAGVACQYGSECLGAYCSGDGFCSTCPSTVDDDDANTYNTVQIGEQCWMAENLNVGNATTSENTGSTHSDVSDDGIVEKYCYDNNESNCTTDGGLYDWNEAMGYTTSEGAQGICPTGWHIPTDAEWYELENGLATESCSDSRTDWGCAPAGTNLKENGSSGFEALLAGYRSSTGAFYYRGSSAYFWSSSESGGNAWRRYLYSGYSTVSRGTRNKAYGFSVRCLKD